MGRGITDIRIVDSWGTSPARINRETGEVEINSSYLPVFRNRNKAFFILGHEDTHSRRDTMSEFEADQGASELYFKQRLSPRDSVLALAEVLSFNSPEHIERVRAQALRAAYFDCAVNKHKPSCDMIAANTYRPIMPADIDNFNFSDFCGPICKRRNAKIAAAVNAVISNNTTVQNSIATAAQNAVAQNTPPPAAQQNANPSQNNGGSGGGNSQPLGPPDIGDDGGDNGDNSFEGMTPKLRAQYNRAQRANYSTFADFCGPLCEAAKAKNERKEREADDKKVVGLAQADAQVKQTALDNQQKAKEAEAATKQTEAVAKSLNEGDKGGNNLPVMIGLFLLFAAAGIFFYLKSKKGKGAPAVNFSAN